MTLKDNEWPEALNEAIYRYRAMIPFIDERADLSKKPSGSDALCHVAWMLEQIRPEFGVEKAMRWLCFAQGVLWGESYITIDEAREDNRKILEVL
jgi:hypothetical protein